MSDRSNRTPSPRVNFFDGQRVTESDLDTEQAYNRSVSSNAVLDFHGSGVVNSDPFGKKILLDTRVPGYYANDGSNESKSAIEAGTYDGKPVYLDRGCSDSDYGNRLVFELSNSEAMGRNITRVMILGRAFDGVGNFGEVVTEILEFSSNYELITKHYYLDVIAVIFNNFSGGLGSSYHSGQSVSEDLISDTGGGITVREAGYLEVHPSCRSASQQESPNIGINNFISSSVDRTIEDEVLEAFGADISFGDLYFQTESKEKIYLNADASPSLTYGQKFLADSNNIQRVDILLSVEGDPDADSGAEFDFSGDITLSIHKLSTDTTCISDFVPEDLISFDPEPDSIAEVSLSSHDLYEMGLRLDSTPRIVSFSFSGTLIADPNIEPSIDAGSYYAIMVRRSGDNRTGNVVLEKGYDKVGKKSDDNIPLTIIEQFDPQRSRFFEYDPDTRRHIDDSSSSLWFCVNTDSVGVTSGTAYSNNGFEIVVPKYIDYVGDTKVSNIGVRFDLSDVGEGSRNYAVLSGESKFDSPDVHPRTGNFVFSRILDWPSISIVDESGLEAASISEYPLILARVTDDNTREAQPITGSFSLPGEIAPNKIVLVNPSSEILAENLINRVLTPDLNCECASKYRIVATKCYDVYAGDFDGDELLTLSDIPGLLNVVGNTINSEETERRILSGELDIIDFIKADLNDDDTVDGFDIELLENAIDGYVNFSVSEKIRVFEIYLENIHGDNDFGDIFYDSDYSGESISGSNTITLSVSDYRTALVMRPGDTVSIPSDFDDHGTYFIREKIISSDRLTVTLSVSDESGIEASFSGSFGIDLTIKSGTATNMYLDNMNLVNVPFTSTEYSIDMVQSDFYSRFLNICDLRRFVHSTFIEEELPDPCICVDDDCEPEEDCDPQYKNQYLIPDDLYIPNGEIYSEPGIPYHGDIEYVNVIMPIPPGTISDCQVDLYNAFVKSQDGSCRTEAGFEAMVYSDGTYVGCEDDGTNTDISKNRVKFSHALASLYVDALVDGYADDGYVEDSRTSYTTEIVSEEFFDYTFIEYSSWIKDAFSSSNFIITNSSGLNQPLIFETSTVSDASKRYANIAAPPDALLYGDFMVDFTAYRGSWDESSITSGDIFLGSKMVITNADGSYAEIYYGWRQRGLTGAKISYFGEIYDSGGSIVSSFDFYEDPPDSVGDEILFRIRRTNDVVTAYYYNPDKIDFDANPDQQYVRVGENMDMHPGYGDGQFSYEMFQADSPASGISLYGKIVTTSVYTSYRSEELDDSFLISRNATTNYASRATLAFPLNINQKTQVISAKLVFQAEDSFSTTDEFNIMPLNVMNADNLGILYNYPLSDEVSYMSTFTPGAVSAGDTFDVDVTYQIIAFISTSGHLPGFYKGFLLEADETADSEMKLSSLVQLVVEYLDITTGVIFKIGVSLDRETGIVTLNTKNILYDSMIETDRTVINFGVYLKKSGFANKDREIGILDLARIGIGTCIDETIVELEDECFFIAGSTAPGTFVQGPFPCTFHLPPI
jgi:hypothetical protein